MKLENGTRIQILIEKETKEELLKEAKTKGLSLMGYIRMILNERKK